MKQRIEQFTRKEIKQIAEAYANTNIEQGVATSFCERFKIQGSGLFYKILKKAVIESIVSDEVARKMAKKAAENSEKYGGGKAARSRTESSYRNAFEMRKNFRFSDSQIKGYAMAYAKVPRDMSPEEFASINCMTVALLEKTMIAAVIDFLVDEDTATCIMAKLSSLMQDSVAFQEFKDSMLALRKTNRKIRKNFVNGRRLYKNAMELVKEGVTKNHDAAMRKAHKDFILSELSDYAITDELKEYAESMGINLSADEPDEDTMHPHEEYDLYEDDAEDDDPVQMSLLDLLN